MALCSPPAYKIIDFLEILCLKDTSINKGNQYCACKEYNNVWVPNTILYIADDINLLCISYKSLFYMGFSFLGISEPGVIIVEEGVFICQSEKNIHQDVLEL